MSYQKSTREEVIRIDVISGCLSDLARILGDDCLWNEYYVIKRLKYKNNNQHRSFTAHRKVAAVLRILKQLKQGITEQRVLKLIDSDLDLSIQTLFDLKRELQGLKSSAEFAYIAYRSLLSLSHFMATSVVMMSALSRVRAFAIHLTARTDKSISLITLKRSNNNNTMISKMSL